jgi:hypothetical protein
LIKLEQIRRQVAIVGRVTDAQTGQPVRGAQVTITSGPPEFLARLKIVREVVRSKQPPDLAVTGPDGHYHYVDLPAGAYTLTVTLSAAGTRYGSQTAQATVVRDAQGKITPGATDVALPPTGIKGKVTPQGGAQGDALSMAEVRVQGSGERVYTNQKGEYLLLGLETGTRSLRIGARNYQPDVRSVTLGAPGVLVTVDVALTPTPA